MGLGFATLKPSQWHRRPHHRRRRRHHRRRPAHRRRPHPVSRPASSRPARQPSRITPKTPSRSTMSSSAWAGPSVGRTVVNLEINSNDTIVDHTWIWRADHGSGVGWNQNTSANGLVVNGDNVTSLRPLRRASPAVSGAVERQRRTHLLLSIRNSLRPARPGQLHQRARASTAGPPTKWPTASPLMKPGASASTPSSATPTSCSPAPSRFRRSPASASTT